MPGFRYKDLMINVVPEGQGEAAAAGGAGNCTGGISCQFCTLLCTALCSHAATDVCRGCSFVTPVCTALCTNGISQCTPLCSFGCSHCSLGCSGGCGWRSIVAVTASVGTPIFTEAQGTQNLGVLKDQLRQALADIEQHEQAQARATEPQSVEEIESLQEKLRGALEDLETRKGQMGGGKAK